MPEFLGRKIILTWGGANFAGLRERSVAFNGEAIDVSSDDSAGWRVLLDEAGEDSLNVSISGIIATNALKVDWFGGAATRTKAVTITYPDGGVIGGNFYLASYNETGPYKESSTFEAELQSSGPVTYTPPV